MCGLTAFGIAENWREVVGGNTVDFRLSTGCIGVNLSRHLGRAGPEFVCDLSVYDILVMLGLNLDVTNFGIPGRLFCVGRIDELLTFGPVLLSNLPLIEIHPAGQAISLGLDGVFLVASILFDIIDAPGRIHRLIWIGAST